MVAGIEGKDTLFGIGDKIIWNLLIAILVGLGFGVVAIYVIVSNLTKPIRRLVECIRDSRENKLSGYQMSDITEVDELYEVVRELTNKQQEAEYSLMEEKERYRIALQSSTDILYAYDVRQGSLDVYNVDGKEAVSYTHLVYCICMARVYLLPSWKIFPTSIPLDMVRVCFPQTGQMPPSTAFAKS